ncbi:MAG TPA: xanthine dehydrogenase subunit D [Mycobacteriales bacterium]|nr:xanthine dehydrogenase subunit D [Mycobacteriales bacterium]
MTAKSTAARGSTPTLPTHRPGADRGTTPAAGRIGDSVLRPDGVPKVTGDFAYSSDLWMDDMLWGATLRSPHPRARIRSVNIGPALALAGVTAVLTHEDVPGAKTYGLEIADQPVLAIDQVRYAGEAVAIVAADHPETARRAVALIEVDYEVLEPISDMRAAMTEASPLVHEEPTQDEYPGGGNILRKLRIQRGDVTAIADVTVTGEYEVGMQDQAFLGPESGLAVPTEDGGVDLFIATQWLHVDQRQVASALGLPPEKVRLSLAGVGGAFGAREDVSMQIHACLLALHTGRPVKMVYSREESFYGHVHRHPALMRFEHGATYDGKLVFIKADIVLDGGAYASSSPAVVSNAASFAVGPYECDNVQLDGYVLYTNNPPCGAMRGFGAVQVCFGHESQMDKLAIALGIDPVELRIRNAMREGSLMPTGQVIEGAAPVEQILRLVRDAPLPPDADLNDVDVRLMPGGVANTTHGEGVKRGIGYAVGFKNVGFSEGFDDYSTARVRLQLVGGEVSATVHTAAAEVGQGLVTVMAQIARSELGVDQVINHPADTTVGSAGSTSASRQTYCTGGAVKLACEAVREKVLAMAARKLGVPVDGAALDRGDVVDAEGRPLAALAAVLGDDVIEETREFHHRPTVPLTRVAGANGAIGQGDAHLQFAFAAHRVVADVDVDLGLVRLVEVTTAQDVGKALNPLSVVGQIQGGTTQGIGLALMEEIQLRDGLIRNPSFTDYLIPTILDTPPMQVHVLELGDPLAPYGLRGVGEPPTISSTPAVVSALRAASGRPLTRVPVQPEHITGT